MNKRLVTILLSLATAAVPAFADIVKPVDFGEMGLNTTVLASPTTPDMVSQVITRLNFSYTGGVTETVSVNSGGILGTVDLNMDSAATLTGDLSILFPYPVTGLRFTFLVDGTPNPDIPNNLVSFFSPFSPIDSGSSSIVTNLDGTSTFSYGAAFGGTPVDPFSSVDLYFGNGTDSQNFFVDSMQYAYAPEPASFLLLGINLLAFGGIMRFRRRS